MIVEWLWDPEKSIELSIKTWLAIAFILRVFLITLKSGLSQCRKTLLNENNAFSPASTQDTESWVPLIRAYCGVNLFVCCLAEVVVSGDYTCICIFLKTNRLSLSLSRVCLSPNWIEGKKLSPIVSSVDTWCLAAGGGEQRQRESRGKWKYCISWLGREICRYVPCQNSSKCTL